jgi:hypothetical protein
LLGVRQVEATIQPVADDECFLLSAHFPLIFLLLGLCMLETQCG